jgi:plastocyanin
MHPDRLVIPTLLAVLISGCSSSTARKPEEKPVVFHVDPATAGTISGSIRFTGRRPQPKIIDMDQEPECARLHKGGLRPDEPLVVNAKGAVANVFVYLKAGLEGKHFEVPAAPVTIDQNGCWFQPRVLGLQTGQTLMVTNSDPVTHNIHPLAHVNREWNHSQGQGDPALSRRFLHSEVMIPVKCNIHKWMHAYLGVVEHPYFAVTGADGTFELRNVPPGNYTIAAWQESLQPQERQIAVPASGKVDITFTFKGE